MTFKKPFRAQPVIPGVTYLAKIRRKRMLRVLRTAGLLTLVAVGTFGLGMVLTNMEWAVASPTGSSAGTHFSLCSGPIRRNCVVDGDTFWMDGRKIRIADIDTPEVSEPKCQSEYDRGMQATHRLRELLNEGPFDLSAVGRDEDSYGRELRVVVRSGRSLGDQLVSEGLARTWTGRREPWC